MTEIVAYFSFVFLTQYYNLHASSLKSEMMEMEL